MADSSSDIFMAMEYAGGGKLEGESTDDMHPDEIRLLSFSAGVARSIQKRVGTAGGREAQSEFQDVVVTAIHSKASPAFFAAAAKGMHFSTVTISFRKSGTERTGPCNGDFLQVQLTDVYVTNYQSSHEGPGSSIPMDTITLNFGKIEWLYVQQNQKGALDQSFCKGWDVGKNKELTDYSLPYKNKNAKKPK